MSSNTQIVQRLDSIQKELDTIRSSIAGAQTKDDWRHMEGVFANEPLFEKAVRYGKKYRQSLRPKTTKGRTRGR